MLLNLDVGVDAEREMVGFVCQLPRGASIVGWIDFDCCCDSESLQKSRFALVMTRSGRVFASKHDEIRAVPQILFSYIRLRVGSVRHEGGRTEGQRADGAPGGSEAE